MAYFMVMIYSGIYGYELFFFTTWKNIFPFIYSSTWLNCCCKKILDFELRSLNIGFNTLTDSFCQKPQKTFWSKSTSVALACIKSCLSYIKLLCSYKYYVAIWQMYYVVILYRAFASKCKSNKFHSIILRGCVIKQLLVLQSKETCYRNGTRFRLLWREEFRRLYNLMMICDM